MGTSLQQEIAESVAESLKKGGGSSSSSSSSGKLSSDNVSSSRAKSMLDALKKAKPPATLDPNELTGSEPSSTSVHVHMTVLL